MWAVAGQGHELLLRCSFGATHAKIYRATPRGKFSVTVWSNAGVHRNERDTLADAKKWAESALGVKVTK